MELGWLLRCWWLGGKAARKLGAGSLFRSLERSRRGSVKREPVSLPWNGKNKQTENYENIIADLRFCVHRALIKEIDIFFYRCLVSMIQIEEASDKMSKMLLFESYMLK